MSHDFARTHRPAEKKPPEKKRPAKRKGVSPVLWIVVGTLLGAFVMFLLYVSGLNPQLKLAVPGGQPAPAAKHAAAPVQPQSTPSEEPAAPARRTSPVFEFYTKLPENGEPIVDSASTTALQKQAQQQDQQIQQQKTDLQQLQQQEAAPPVQDVGQPAPPAADPIQQLLAQQEAQKKSLPSAEARLVGNPAEPKAVEANPAAAPPADLKAAEAKTVEARAAAARAAVEAKKTAEAKKAAEAKLAAAKAEKVVGKGNYMLQVGAFPLRSKADALRAKLLMLGLSARIQASPNAKGETMHKVLVGPFASEADMQDAKIILDGNHIGSFPVR